MKNLRSIVVLFALIIVLAACTPAVQMDSQPTPTPDSDTSTDSSDADVLVVDIGAQSFSFAPNVINAAPGQTVKVNFTNNGGTHNFNIDELSVSSGDTNTGDTVSFEFTIPEDASGKSYEFYCGISNHRALGMVGTLNVN